MLCFSQLFFVFLDLDSDTSTQLQWIGHNAVSLGYCQGDCDNDSNCDGDLICWQRGSTDTDPIPGCTGDLLAIDTVNNDPGIDYCYDPTASVRVCNVSICANGDDRLTVSVSYDGTVFEELSYESTWWTTTELTLTNIVAPTVLHFEADDNQHTGGFLATIRLQCNDGYNRTIITDEGNTNFEVVYSLNNDYEMDVFNALSEGRNPNSQCMDPNAYWMWNGRNSDDVIFELDLFPDTLQPTVFPTENPTTMDPTSSPSVQPTPLAPKSAKLSLHCDNVGTTYISYDGNTFSNVGSVYAWTEVFEVDLTDVTEDTVIRHSCYDNGVVGAFIATIDYNGKNYSTTNPLSDGYWEIMNSSDGVTSPLVYNDKLSDPWNRYSTGIAQDAWWVWNDVESLLFVFE